MTLDAARAAEALALQLADDGQWGQDPCMWLGYTHRTSGDHMLISSPPIRHSLARWLASLATAPPPPADDGHHTRLAVVALSLETWAAIYSADDIARADQVEAAICNDALDREPGTLETRFTIAADRSTVSAACHIRGQNHIAAADVTVTDAGHRELSDLARQLKTIAGAWLERVT